MSHVLTDAGLILITSISDADSAEIKMLKSLNQPNRTLVINVGDEVLPEEQADLDLPANLPTPAAVAKILDLLVKAVVLDPEYNI